MSPLRRPTIAEQVADVLRDGIRTGRWQRELPGVIRLASELDVSKVTMRTALRLMEAEGLVAQEGQRRARVVVRRDRSREARNRSGALRVSMLLDRPLQEHRAAEREYYSKIQLAIESLGHACAFTSVTQSELNHNASRVARHFREVPADAWIVVDGRRHILEWFAEQSLPVLALGGSKVDGIAYVGRDLKPMLRDVIHRFTSLGHQRIAFLFNERSQLPHSSIPNEILSEFATRRIPASAAYNTPIWTETEDGLRQLLDALFRITPPTAVFAQDMKLLFSTLSFMASRGLRVPAHVSLVGGFCDGDIEWTESGPAHYRSDTDAQARQVARWIAGVARGRPSTEWHSEPAVFVPGNSLAPPPARKI